MQSGYLPDVDEVLASQTGICFDYAAVMASMLRCERIPTRLEVGYMGEVYHAWTFASTSSDPKDFLTQTDEYITKYVY